MSYPSIAQFLTGIHSLRKNQQRHGNVCTAHTGIVLAEEEKATRGCSILRKMKCAFRNRTKPNHLAEFAHNSALDAPYYHWHPVTPVGRLIKDASEANGSRYGLNGCDGLHTECSCSSKRAERVLQSPRGQQSSKWKDESMFRLICVLCYTMFICLAPCISAATVVCSVENSFRVNQVYAICKDTNAGAMPLGIKSSSMQYDFLKIGQDADRVSLVRSTMDTYVSCSDLNLNTVSPTSTASGHMRPVPGTTSTLVPVLVSDSVAAAAAMQEGFYDVCFFEARVGTWVNTGIGLVVQRKLLGLEVMGIAHAEGTRIAVPLATMHPVTIAPKLAAGVTLVPGDQIMFIDVLAKCSIAPQATPDGESPIESGFLNFSETGGGQFVGSSVLPIMKSGWYQVCFKSGSGISLIRTGIALHVQHDVAAVEVNGIKPNGGADVSLPPAARSKITLHRIVPKLGYHQAVQASVPAAYFSFEDQNDNEMFDSHCGQTCQADAIFKSGLVENGPRGSFYQPAVGTYKYMSPNGEDTHAYSVANITSPSLAFSIAFVMQWQPQSDSRMEILAPFKTSLGNFEKGALSIALRVDSNSVDAGTGAILQRQLQLKVTGFQDEKQGVSGADTVLFEHRFEKETWYFIAITLDMATDGIARLYVNGQRESTPKANKFVPNPRMFPPARHLRLAPASIGAHHDGDALKNVFNGFLDEVSEWRKRVRQGHPGARLCRTPHEWFADLGRREPQMETMHTFCVLRFASKRCSLLAIVS